MVVVYTHVAARDYPAGIQRCFNHTQTQREPSVLRKLPWRFTLLHRMQDTRQDPAQPSHTAPRPGTTSREPMWIQERARDHRHGVCCKAASREMSTKCRLSVVSACGDYVQVRLPTEVHRHGEIIPWWHTSRDPGQRRDI